MSQVSMQDLARCSLLERRRSSDIGSSKRLPVNCWRLEEHLPKEQALLLSQILGPMMEAWTVTVVILPMIMISLDSTSVAGRSCAQMHCASSCCCIAGAAKERALHRSKEKKREKPCSAKKNRWSLSGLPQFFELLQCSLRSQEKDRLAGRPSWKGKSTAQTLWINIVDAPEFPLVWVCTDPDRSNVSGEKLKRCLPCGSLVALAVWSLNKTACCDLASFRHFASWWSGAYRTAIQSTEWSTPIADQTFTHTHTSESEMERHFGAIEHL